MNAKRSTQASNWCAAWTKRDAAAGRAGMCGGRSCCGRGWKSPASTTRKSLRTKSAGSCTTSLPRGVSYGIAFASEQEIDEINILQATFLAMERAMQTLSPQPQLALIDGNRAKDFGLPVRTIVKGDSLSASIAAASILAKVTRDRLMEEYDAQYPQYGFAVHKGYGTKRHYEALLRIRSQPDSQEDVPQKIL